VDPDPDPGGPKACGSGGSGSGFGSGSATLVLTVADRHLLYADPGSFFTFENINCFGFGFKWVSRSGSWQNRIVPSKGKNYEMFTFEEFLVGLELEASVGV
jgi:hypothetical protein